MGTQTRFESEFVKILARNPTRSFYVAVRLSRRGLAFDRTLISRVDNDFNQSYWEFLKDEKNMPGSFLSVDDSEENMYLYYKKDSLPKNHIIVLDPQKGDFIRAKLLVFKQDLELVNFKAYNSHTLYLTAMSKEQVFLCKYVQPNDIFNCSISTFPKLSVSITYSLLSPDSIQTAFSDSSIMVSVDTSYR